MHLNSIVKYDEAQNEYEKNIFSTPALLQMKIDMIEELLQMHWQSDFTSQLKAKLLKYKARMEKMSEPVKLDDYK